jgi:hypothetical protein
LHIIQLPLDSERKASFPVAELTARRKHSVLPSLRSKKGLKESFEANHTSANVVIVKASVSLNLPEARLRFPLLALLLCFATTTGATSLRGQDTAAKWIWYPEDPAKECVKQKRWFRKSFELRASVKSAELWFLADDRQSLWVNGHGVGDPLERRGSSQRYDLSERLSRGSNQLAVEGYNASGPAGIIARLEILTIDGDRLIINSDTSWKSFKQEREGWNRLLFDDFNWVPARSFGNAFSQPWIGIPAFQMDVFISEEEMVASSLWRELLMAPDKMFADEKRTIAALKYYNGAPALFIDGQPRPVVMYRGTIDPFQDYGRRQIANFCDAGIHVFCPFLRIEKCWLKQDEYDFSYIDEQIRAYLSVDPEAYLILLVSLIPPEWWMQAHPNEWVRYATSDDLQGGSEMSRARRASLASDVWIQDTAEAWRALIRHFEASPWGKRVIGYHPSYGISSEWHYFGSWTDQYPDTGPAMTRTFRDWLRSKYDRVDNLQKAWKNPEVTFETAAVPGVAPRKRGSLITFRDPTQEKWVIDYYRCHQKVIADAIELLGRITKEETSGRALFGVYYGYFYGVRPQTQGGHLELERLLKSPFIDYFVAPYDYSHRLIGDDGRLRSLAAAFNKAGKTHILEADIRTHLHPSNEYGRAANLTESLAVIGREFSTTLTEHTGFWYTDFGPSGAGGWFDDPQIMALAGKLYDLASQALEKNRQSVAEIALICDLESSYYLSDGPGMSIVHEMIDLVGTEMYHMGAPFDAFLLSQITELDLSRYRLLVFLNTFAMTDRQVSFIEGLRKGGQHEMVFLWAPGFCSQDSLSVERISRVVGLDLKLVDKWVQGTAEITNQNDSLLGELSGQRVYSIDPTSTVPIAAFANIENWFNPRSAEEMKKNYRIYNVEVIENGMKWTFDTNYSWTDIHCKISIPSCDGISYVLGLEGECNPLVVKCVVKDTTNAEFVSPGATIAPGESRNIQYSLASFDIAPWSKQRQEKLTLPISGLKFLVENTPNAGTCSLTLRDFHSIIGEVTPKTVFTFGQGVFRPAFIPSSPQGRRIGKISGTDFPALVAVGGSGSTSVFSTIPFAPREVLLGLIHKTRIHQYLKDTQDVIRVDSQYLAIHTKRGGLRALSFPFTLTVYDALSHEILGRGQSIQVNLPPSSTKILSFDIPR